jgi:hypothetical protein
MNIKATCIIAAAAAFAIVNAVQAEQTIVAITPALPDQNAKNEVYRTILTAALQDIAPGDTIEVIDGWSVKSITRLSVPAHQAYARDPKARAKAMQSSIAALNTWLTTESPERSQVPAYGLRAPAIFEFCATHTEMAKAKGRLVLIGTTIFDDPAEIAFSMRDGYFPADAHLGVSRQESVFGLKDASKRLEGTIVHWAGWVRSIKTMAIALLLKDGGRCIASSRAAPWRVATHRFRPFFNALRTTPAPPFRELLPTQATNWRCDTPLCASAFQLPCKKARSIRRSRATKPLLHNRQVPRRNWRRHRIWASCCGEMWSPDP